MGVPTKETIERMGNELRRPNGDEPLLFTLAGLKIAAAVAFWNLSRKFETEIELPGTVTDPAVGDVPVTHPDHESLLRHCKKQGWVDSKLIRRGDQWFLALK